jgi:hypothetical protein
MPTSEASGSLASNPTTGAGTPTAIHVAGIGITAVGVDLTTQDNNPNPYSDEGQVGSFGQVGQGHGAVQTSVASHPQAQYGLTLSLSGKTVNGVAYPTETAAVATLVDVLNDAVAVSEYYDENFVWVAEGCPQNQGWYRRSNSFVSTTASPESGSPAYPGAGSATPSVVVLGTPYGTYDADVVIQAKAVGQAVVEVSYSTFDNPFGDGDGYNAFEQEPLMKVFAQIVVQVIP